MRHLIALLTKLLSDNPLLDEKFFPITTFIRHLRVDYFKAFLGTKYLLRFLRLTLRNIDRISLIHQNRTALHMLCR